MEVEMPHEYNKQTGTFEQSQENVSVRCERFDTRDSDHRMSVKLPVRFNRRFQAAKGRTKPRAGAIAESGLANGSDS